MLAKLPCSLSALSPSSPTMNLFGLFVGIHKVTVWLWLP